MKFLEFFNKKVNPTKYIPQAKYVYSNSGGKDVNPDSAMQVSAFYRGLIYVSTQVAKLPLLLKDKNKNVMSDDISLLLDLAPNPEMSSFMFWIWNIQTSILYGNAISEIDRTVSGRPIGLWPIMPGSWTMLRAPDGSLVYRVFESDTGKEIFLQARDVLHVRNFHTKNGLIGEGVVSYGRDVLGISLGADGFANALFANGGLPSGILTTPNTLSDEAFARVQESWKAGYGGRKTGGLAILEDGLEFKATSFSPDILQFLESRKFNVVEIARFLGVPPAQLFDTDSMTYKNIEDSQMQAANSVLDCWVVNLEQEIDIKILNKRNAGRTSEFDMFQISRGDMKTRADYYGRMMANGAVSPNEIRIKEGFAPYEGGDRFYIATNNYTPSDRMDEVIDAQIKPKEEPVSDDTDKDLDQKQIEESATQALLNSKVVEFLDRRIHN
jgi:HK97 family phage portal protein